MKFKKGFYAYIGSAQNSLEKRILRHFSKEKKMRWHIDYLLAHAKIKEVWIKENASKQEECETARIFAKTLSFVKGFGSGDCTCKSHLFYSENEKSFENLLRILRFKESNPNFCKSVL